MAKKIPRATQCPCSAKCADARGNHNRSTVSIFFLFLCAFSTRLLQLCGPDRFAVLLTQGTVAVGPRLLPWPNGIPAGRTPVQHGRLALLRIGRPGVWAEAESRDFGRTDSRLALPGGLPGLLAQSRRDGFTLDDVRFTDQEFVAINRSGLDALYTAKPTLICAARLSVPTQETVLYHGLADEADPPLVHRGLLRGRWRWNGNMVGIAAKPVVSRGWYVVHGSRWVSLLFRGRKRRTCWPTSCSPLVFLGGGNGHRAPARSTPRSFLSSRPSGGGLLRRPGSHSTRSLRCSPARQHPTGGATLHRHIEPVDVKTPVQLVGGNGQSLH